MKILVLSALSVDVWGTSKDFVKREWGAWLRAPDRRSANMQGSKWLRDSNHMEITQSSNGQGETGNDDRRLRTEGNLKSYHNPVFSGNSETKSLEYISEDMGDPQRILNDISYRESAIKQAENYDEDIGLNLNEDRKRRREAQVEKAQSTK